MTSTPVTHTSTPLAPAGTEATPSQYVAMPAERPQGIAPLYVPNTLHASKKCHFPLSAVEISRHGSTAARQPGRRFSSTQALPPLTVFRAARLACGPPLDRSAGLTAPHPFPAH